MTYLIHIQIKTKSQKSYQFFRTFLIYNDL